MIRIASGQAFWGDWPQAPALQVRSGPIDYLVLDYLAEVTVAILDKQARRQPGSGFARDFVDDIGNLLPEIMEGGIRVIASAGGVNPRGCAEALLAKARELGVNNLRVGVVDGDDVLERLLDGTISITPLADERQTFTEVAPRLTSARAYLGARPIVEALQQDAHVVITGRVTDTALTLAPFVYELAVEPDDWDALALGTVVGHILECGAQASGGNYLADWRSVPDAERIGFPIAEIATRDQAVITKHAPLGGRVTSATVKEQLLYEIGNPCGYLSADCIADFTTIELTDLGENRVSLRGVAGRPAPQTLKVSCVYDAGWKVSGQIVYPWPDAAAKARRAGEIVRRRAEPRLGPVFDAWESDVIGAGACFGGDSCDQDLPEVALRVAARSADRYPCDEVGRELVGLILTGPPGATGYAGPRPKASQVRAIWSGVVPRGAVSPCVKVFEI